MNETCYRQTENRSPSDRKRQLSSICDRLSAMTADYTELDERNGRLSFAEMAWEKADSVQCWKWEKRSVGMKLCLSPPLLPFRLPFLRIPSHPFICVPSCPWPPLQDPAWESEEQCELLQRVSVSGSGSSHSAAFGVEKSHTS